MKLKNATKISDSLLREIIGFANPNNSLGGVAINIKNRSRVGARGFCYWGIPSISPYSKDPTVKRLITIGINCKTKFPHMWYTGLGRVPDFEVRTIEELLVAIIAHELRHSYQMDHNKPRAETDCERFAHKRVLKWRESTRLS